VRTIFAIAFAAVFLYVSTANWLIILVYVLKKKHSSWVPLVGGLSGCLAILVDPTRSFREYWWFPLIADWGCVPGFTHALFYMLFYFIRARTIRRRSDRS
jgi:hypothetical protein